MIYNYISPNNKRVQDKENFPKDGIIVFIKENVYSKIKNQKQVELILNNSPDFGHIDSWLLLSYMQSTKYYKNKITGLNGKN